MLTKLLECIQNSKKIDLDKDHVFENASNDYAAIPITRGLLGKKVLHGLITDNKPI